MSYFTEQLENILVWSVPMDSKAQTKKLIERIQKLVDEEVIGTKLVHSDEIEFIDPIRKISSIDRVKIWNECKEAARARLYGEEK